MKTDTEALDFLQKVRETLALERKFSKGMSIDSRARMELQHASILLDALTMALNSTGRVMK